MGYEAEHDMDNTCSSVFCAHGAGFVVEWDQVEAYMHLESTLTEDRKRQDGEIEKGADSFAARYAKRRGGDTLSTAEDFIGQEEIEEIINRTYGPRERKKQGYARTFHAPAKADTKYKGQ